MKSVSQKICDIVIFFSVKSISQTFRKNGFTEKLWYSIFFSLDSYVAGASCIFYLGALDLWYKDMVEGGVNKPRQKKQNCINIT